MPPKLKLLKKKPCFTPRPVAHTQGVPLTQALSFHFNGDNDDDDFQSPISVILPSSLRKTPISQPSKPYSGSHPEKKPRLKESAPVNQIEGIGSKVPSPVFRNLDLNAKSSFDEKEETLSPLGQKCVESEEEAVDLSSTARWSLLESPATQTRVTNHNHSCYLSFGFDENRGTFLDSLSAGSQIIENSTKTKVESSLVDSSSASIASSNNKLKLGENSPKEKCINGAKRKGKYHLNSIESKLVESGSKSETHKSEIDSEMKINCLIVCPLCGVDLSDLNEESRQLHTNNCLDNCEASEASDSKCDTKSNLAKGNIDTSSVIEWLRNLGLSKYEEIFVREEIDWDTLKCLTEEDLLNIGITTLGSRKKIMNALRESLNKTNDNTAKNCIQSTVTKEIKLSMAGNKLITEYFIGSSKSKPNLNGEVNLKKPVNNSINNINNNNNNMTNGVIKRNFKKKGKSKGDVPTWCCVPGTPFRVDAFKYLEGSCSHWFLSHFHMDHYQGLTKKFCHGKIYCSAITARLINLKIGVPMEKIYILALNQKLNIAGVNIYCFDANHCPGSLIILFEPPNGKAVLHTGDFRFSSDMKNNPILNMYRINTLILDTTYCSPQYDFPKQEAVIQFVIEAIQAEAFNPRTLFLIGSYTIGKERVFLEVARVLKKKIYVGAAKMSILKCLDLPQEQMQWLTANEAESNIHVVPMWTLASFKRMKYVSKQYNGQYDLIVAFSPTGWSFGKGMKKTPGRRSQQGTIIRYEVPYSEHSSFTELREFVRFIFPEQIIPSVNNNGPQSADSMRALLLSDF